MDNKLDATGFDKEPGTDLITACPAHCTLSALVRGSKDDVIVSEPMNDAHRITGIHLCTDVHEDYHGIKLHVCQCGARFYFVRDAVEVLVGGFVRMRSAILSLETRTAGLEDVGDKHGY